MIKAKSRRKKSSDNDRPNYQNISQVIKDAEVMKDIAFLWTKDLIEYANEITTGKKPPLTAKEIKSMKWRLDFIPVYAKYVSQGLHFLSKPNCGVEFPDGSQEGTRTIPVFTLNDLAKLAPPHAGRLPAV